MGKTSTYQPFNTIHKAKPNQIHSTTSVKVHQDNMPYFFLTNRMERLSTFTVSPKISVRQVLILSPYDFDGISLKIIPTSSYYQKRLKKSISTRNRQGQRERKNEVSFLECMTFSSPTSNSNTTTMYIRDKMVDQTRNPT